MYEVKVLGAERALKSSDDLHNALAVLQRFAMQFNNNAVLGIVDTTTGELLTYTA